MQQSLQEFALSLHPDKTRLIEFGRHAADRRTRRGLGKPETFTFLGFIFICGRARSGKFLLKRKSRPDRMQSKLKEIKEALRQRMAAHRAFRAAHDDTARVPATSGLSHPGAGPGPLAADRRRCIAGPTRVKAALRSSARDAGQLCRHDRGQSPRPPAKPLRGPVA